MKPFQRTNNILGWVAFLVSGVVFALTVEPTVSFWDCGEFITAAGKLEVGHPPGAPLFLMLGRVFALFAPNVQHIALCINFLSVLASAFTVMFLFWTVVRISNRMLNTMVEPTKEQQIVVWIVSMAASLTFAFSDSFWFSAVEAEVYACSTLFTSLVFWAILKWDAEYTNPFANRWIILIAFLLGLSIGIHLLNLLTIPALALVIYFRRWKPTVVGFLLALLAGFCALGAIQFLFIPGTIKLAAASELFAVNQLNLSYHTGTLAYFAFVVIALIIGIWLTLKWRRKTIHLFLLSAFFILLGYSSYSIILIRASANPPMNENHPDNVFSLLSYLNREQYAEQPLLYGPNYNAPILETQKGEPVYECKNGKYEAFYYRPKYVYDQRFCTIFPRMYSSNGDHIEFYKSWGNVHGKPIIITDNKESRTEICPTLSENITFFFSYQVYYMYVRYFLWNFAGKQNDLDGNGGLLKGNFITGLPFIDNGLFGVHSKLPDYLKNHKAYNRYFLIPLLLGLFGLIFQLLYRKSDFAIVLLLFLMTGLAIVVYLNQTPLQPRERDYAYIGSFYAFSIWIGIGLLAIYYWLKKVGRKLVLFVVSLFSFSLPLLMAGQNWDDHDRSQRFTARALAWNYLQSCAPNAILFTDGDNDTFPLWYLQEIEGVRTDVRVVNLALLNSEWYISQMKRKAYQSNPLPISLTEREFREGNLDFVYLIEHSLPGMSLDKAVAKAASHDLSDKYKIDSTEYLDMIPSKSFHLAVDDSITKSNGTTYASDSVPQIMQFQVQRGYLSKSTLVVFDIIAQNQWKRPVYFISPQGSAMGFDSYLRLEGFAYRLTPVISDSIKGSIAVDTMYSRIMNRFQWGSMSDPKVFIDNFNQRMVAIAHIRENFGRLALALNKEGKHDSARNVIAKICELMPANAFPYDRFSPELIGTAFEVGATVQAWQLLNGQTLQCNQTLQYIESLPHRLSLYMLYEKNTNLRMLNKLHEIAKINSQKLRSNKREE